MTSSKPKHVAVFS